MFWCLILPCRSSHTHYILIPMLMIVSVLQYVTLHCTGHDLWQLMAYFSTCSFRQISSILQMTVQKFTRYFKSQKSQTTPRVYIFLVKTHQNSAAALLSDRDDESRYHTVHGSRVLHLLTMKIRNFRLFYYCADFTQRV